MYLEITMKVGILFSGGKDSTFALAWAIGQGWDVRCLLSMKSENPESYMFHFPNIHLVEEQAKCLNLPLLTIKTKGEKETELKDLKKLLKKAKEKHKITGIITGALASDYQEERINRICHDLDLKTYSPLWHKNQEQLLTEMLEAGFEIKIVAIAAYGLTKEFVGKTITIETLQKLKQLHKKYGIHIAAEGGEYESLVVDCPLFKKRIKIEDAETIMEDENTGRYVIKKVKLEDKKPKFYRITVDNVGVYEAVDKQCPKNDSRRKNKPDGSWLPKAGLKYPGAISYWTEYGLKKYINSGLLKWHESVIQGKVEVLIIGEPKEILYEDEYQIICSSDKIKIKEKAELSKFLAK